MGRDEIDHLERLGLQILDQEEVREPIDNPFYTLDLQFTNPRSSERFKARKDITELGIVEMSPVRAATGIPDPLRLTARFTERQSAKAVQERTTLLRDAGIVKVAGPTRVGHQSTWRLLVQFPDRQSIERFREEVERYQLAHGGRAALTASQRGELFDSLESISLVQPEDRRGHRLRERGTPEGQFYLDVDLWHPGPEYVSEAIQQFRNLVSRLGGVPTDGPSSVAGSLLLARVRGTAATLEELLAYDRVAYVDLPPTITLPPYSIFDDIDIASPTVLTGDGPIACVIDSGVVAGHPLLAGLVVDERDFDSGELTVVDLTGHGTHVAGLVAYGDLARCISDARWQAQVRLLSAKVMKRIDDDVAGFADTERATTQISSAIRTFAKEYGCRIFNLSIGDEDRPFTGGRQLPWALMIDELARELNVVVVVSAGNVRLPKIPDGLVSGDFQEAVREQLFSPEHRLIDPACASLALTVGSIARTDVTFSSRRAGEGVRPPLVGSPADCPSPFTRTGRLNSSGSGPERAVKPELVAYGGNYCLDTARGNQWNRRDPLLGEPSLNIRYLERLLAARSGTSFSAPYITHCCAIVEAELRRRNPGRPQSANLIRALVVHSATYSAEVREWMRRNTDGESRERLLRTVGYGMPNAMNAAFSSDSRAVLVAEDILPERISHVYELELPPEFLEGGGRRRLRVTLAYDPPVRGNRRDYLCRTMRFNVYRGLTEQEVYEAIGRVDGDADTLPLPNRNKLDMQPSSTMLQWSTVQSALCEHSNARSFTCPTSIEGPSVVHIVVGCAPRSPAPDLSTEQRYAIVVSLERDDETIRLYQAVRQRVEQRVRLHWG